LFYKQKNSSSNRKKLKDKDEGKIGGRLDPLVGDECEFNESP
jgi:hypothetical protein